MSDIPLCQFSRLTCAKGFQFGYDRKHKHFCVLYAVTGKIIWAGELSCHVLMVYRTRLSQRLSIAQTESCQV